MGISAGASTSRRGYLSQDELEQFADITVTDSNEADDQISQAEEMIDAYVGFQEKFMRVEVKGKCASAGGNNTLYLDSDQHNVYQNDYFVGCEIEIIGGTGAGKRRRVSDSDYATGKITVAANWSTNPSTDSFYRIYQLGKFPRVGDVTYYTDSIPYQYYKAIPEAVKRAVAAQVKYIVDMGDAYFNTDKVMKKAESISKYSYENQEGTDLKNKLIAPKAQMLLKGIRNRVGSFA